MPAKAYITCTKYPTGYFSCTKCIQEGDWEGRVVFPDTDCPLRTDHSFENMDQEEHHNGTSILGTLNIGMVSKIAIDYMHLVCLGVVKRLIQFWIKGPRHIRLTSNKVTEVSEALLAMRSSIPKEFARQPRKLDTIDKWKATECRQFLLYTGPVVLRRIMSAKYYQHFLTLSTAIRILCDPRLCVDLNDYAKDLLKWYVIEFKRLYGTEYVTHNVHNLIHLADEVKLFGCLDRFSCFKFENFMKNIKRKLQNAPRPLEQIINRTFEENSLPIIIDPKYAHPIVNVSKQNSKINALIYRDFTLTKKRNGNCCLLNELLYQLW